MTLVLDASSLLAFLHDEPGAERVRSALSGAIVSAVNWSEVVQKSLQRQADIAGLRQEFEHTGVEFLPFTPEHAEIAALLWDRTRQHGLSLGDRACLALATLSVLFLLAARVAQIELALERLRWLPQRNEGVPPADGRVLCVSQHPGSAGKTGRRHRHLDPG